MVRHAGSDLYAVGAQGRSFGERISVSPCAEPYTLAASRAGDARSRQLAAAMTSAVRMAKPRCQSGSNPTIRASADPAC